MKFQPQTIEAMTPEDAEKLLIQSKSLDDFPEIKDTVMGDPESNIGVLLLHGFCGTNLEMTYIGNFLMNKGYRVFIPLLPGHGTTSDDLLGVSAKDWIMTVDDAYHYLLEEKENRRIFVAGHSMGGSLALILASRYPVEGVISLAGPARYPIYLRALAKIAGKLRFKIKYDEFDFGDDYLYDHPGIKHFLETYGRVPVKSFSDVFDVLIETYDGLPYITAPTCLIYAIKDSTVPPYHADIITQHIGTDDIELHWLQNSYHILVIDSDRKLLVDKILGFIQRKLQPQVELKG